MVWVTFLYNKALAQKFHQLSWVKCNKSCWCNERTLSEQRLSKIFCSEIGTNLPTKNIILKFIYSLLRKKILSREDCIKCRNKISFFIRVNKNLIWQILLKDWGQNTYNLIDFNTFRGINVKLQGTNKVYFKMSDIPKNTKRYQCYSK